VLAYVRLSTVARLWRWEPGVDAPRAILDSSTRDEQPALSPDGRRIAFVSSRTGAPELWVRPVDRPEARQLTFAGQPVATPRWSPDGLRLAFTSSAGDNADIYTVRADATIASWRLTFEPSDEGNPSWSNDGRFVYFRSDRGGLPRIWRMAAEGGAAVAVTRGEGSEAMESADGSQVLFVRHRNAPGLWRVPVEGGAETLVQPGVWEGYWAVTRTGLVIFDRPVRSMTDPLAIRIVEPGAGSRQLGVLDTPSSHVPLGVSATRDARSLAWATSEQRAAQLMLVPRWH
jgi:Tol biopolymer transport system component